VAAIVVESCKAWIADTVVVVSAMASDAPEEALVAVAFPMRLVTRFPDSGCVGIERAAICAELALFCIFSGTAMERTRFPPDSEVAGVVCLGDMSLLITAAFDTSAVFRGGVSSVDCPIPV
jgi:hypothetical protein